MSLVIEAVMFNRDVVCNGMFKFNRVTLVNGLTLVNGISVYNDLAVDQILID